MAGKTFKRAVRKEKIWFELPDGNDENVRYNCVDILPAGLVLDFGSNDEDGTGNPLDKVKGFFNGAIRSDQHEQFWAHIHDRESRIGLDMLMEVAEYIAEEFSARPTGGSSSPGPSMTSTGDDSTGGASPVVSIYSRPEPIAASTS